MVFLLSEYKVTDVILSDHTKINCLDLVKLVVVCAYPETVMTLPAYSRVNTWAASRTFQGYTTGRNSLVSISNGKICR